MTATEIHDQLQVALSDAWSKTDRDERKEHAMRATILAGKLFKLAKSSENNVSK